MPQISQLALVYQSQWFWLLLTLAVEAARDIVARLSGGKVTEAAARKAVAGALANG